MFGTDVDYVGKTTCSTRSTYPGKVLGVLWWLCTAGWSTSMLCLRGSVSTFRNAAAGRTYRADTQGARGADVADEAHS